MVDASTIISIAALVVSIGSAVLAWWTARHQNALQARLVEVEDARERDRVRETRTARVRAALVRRNGDKWALELSNDGSATARNIRLQLDGAPVLQHPLVPRRGTQEVTVLGPDASVRYLLFVSVATPPVLTVAIDWDDDSGDPGRWESQLNLF